MSISIGINGVNRDTSPPYIGRSGVKYDVWDGYVGVGGVTRRFITDGVSRVIDTLEVWRFTLTIYSMSGSENTSYTYANVLSVTDTIDNLSKADYSSYGIYISYESDNIADEDGTKYKILKSVTVRSSAVGYSADLGGYVNACIRSNEYSLSSITDKATIKTKAGYSLSFSCRKGGYILSAFGQIVKEGYVSGSASGTTDIEVSNSSFIVSAEVRPDSNSGTATATMSFSDIMIDDETFKLNLGG